MPDIARLLALVVGSYTVGGFVAAYYLVRWRTGTDIRAVGSGNAGARNAARVVGRAGFAVALILDAGKGALVTWTALQLGPHPLGSALAMLAVVAGHIWPAQLGFRGGKGAATSLGVMLVLDTMAALLAVGAGVILLAATRRFTPSGLAAVAIAPLAAGWTGNPALHLVALAGIAVLVLFAHRSNFRAPPIVADDPTMRARGASTR